MPVEIRELVVRIVLDDKKTKTSIDSQELQKMKESIVKECTEKILTKLDNISER